MLNEFSEDILVGIFKRDTIGELTPRFLISEENTVYLWQDNILRIQKEYDLSYESLELSVPFIPLSMMLNATRNMALFYSQTSIYVASLDNTAVRKHFAPAVPIKKVLWHPLSLYGRSMVVLHNDNSIRIYDVDQLNDDSSIIFNPKSRSFGLSERVESICDMIFDPSGLSLFLLSTYNFADIYVIYPCLPKNFTLTSLRKHQISNDSIVEQSKPDYLLNKSLALYNTLENKSKQWLKADLYSRSSCLNLKHDLLKQIRFIKGCQNDGEANNKDHFIENATPQGPFTIKKYPSSLDEKTAVGFTMIPINDTLGMILVQFENGENIILFPNSEPIMSWSRREINEFNSLSVISMFEVQGSAHSLKPDELVFISRTSTSSVKLPWLKFLSECLKVHDFRTLQNEKFDTDIEQLKGVFDGVFCFAGVTVLFNGSSFQIIEPKSKHDRIHNLNSEKEEIRYTYKPSLSASSKELQMLIQSYDSKSKMYLSDIPDELASIPLKNKSNEVQLEVISSLYKEVMERIKLGQTITLGLVNHVSEQQTELHRQLRRLNELNNLKTKSETNLKSLQERYSQYESKSGTLNSRLDKLKEKLSVIERSDSLKSVSISKPEYAWFKTIKSQVVKFNSYVHSSEKLREELTFLEKELQAIDTNKNLFQDIDFDELQDMLLKDKAVISSCINELVESVHDISIN